MTKCWETEARNEWRMLPRHVFEWLTALDSIDAGIVAEYAFPETFSLAELLSDSQKQILPDRRSRFLRIKKSAEDPKTSRFNYLKQLLKMKAIPLRHEVKDGEHRYLYCDANDATHVDFFIPGPLPRLRIPVLVGMSKTRAGTNCWNWNGDVEKPTIRPSVLTDFRPHDPLVNHIWITDGQVIFLGDCSHELAGQTLDLLEVDL